MALFSFLDDDEMKIVDDNMNAVEFIEGDLITEQGSQGDGCYFIDEGTVRVEFDTGETDTDVVLNFLEPGQVVGELSLIDDEPRAATCYAHTPVKARWLSQINFETLMVEHPHIGIHLLLAISHNLIHTVRYANKQLAGLMAEEGSTSDVDSIVSKALNAQRIFQDWPEEKVDALLKDMVNAIINNVDELAESTVKETGLGVARDKAEKIRYASQGVYDVLAGKPASGLIQYHQNDKIEEIASPMGVILGIIPLTNPVPTIIFKALICLKSRNALILSCHRAAMLVGNRTGELIQEVLKNHGAPIYLVQWIKKRSSRKLTNTFMRHKDVSFILATGGPSIVKAAYSSGTPAIGVGAGNAPVFIAKDADIDETAEKIISSKSFDCGVICGSENNLVVEETIRQEFLDALDRHGAKILNEDEVGKLEKKMYDPETGRFNIFMVGQSAKIIAKKVELDVAEDIRLIVVPLPLEKVSGPFGREKPAPVLSLFTVKDADEGLTVSRSILSQMGSGHTAIIHTHDQDLAKRYARAMPASRILVNVGGSLGCIGGGNGLLPSLTLGCGTLGGTSTTDNVTYKNLLNIKRLAYAM